MMFSSNSLEREDDTDIVGAHLNSLPDQIFEELKEEQKLDASADASSSPEIDQKLTFGFTRPPLPSSQEYAELRSKYAKDLNTRQQQQQMQTSGGFAATNGQISSGKAPATGSSILNRSLEKFNQQAYLSGGPFYDRLYATTGKDDRQAATTNQLLTSEELAGIGEINNETSSFGRPKKAVRFQVYNAKDMETIRSMRLTLEEKFNSIRERSQSPNSRLGIQNSSLGFKPGDMGLAQTFNQLANSKKTPRPGMIPLSSDENGTEREIRMDENQLSTLSPPQNILTQSTARERKIKIEQGMQRLAQTVSEIAIVCKSRTTIDSFDLLKAQSDYIGDALERAYFIRSKYQRRKALVALMRWRLMQYRKRHSEILANNANEMRKKRVRHKVLAKMRQVLRFEKLWIADVRYQFAYSLREEAIGGLKTYVKYKRAKRAVKMNRQAHFLNQLTKLVEQSRLRQAQATVYQQSRQTLKVFTALYDYMRSSLIKKAKKAKAIRFNQRQLKKLAVSEWKRQVAAMKRIRGDQLLWQAHTTKSEFFSVSVKVGATLDYKRDRPVTQQTHFLLPDKGELIDIPNPGAAVGGAATQQDDQDQEQFFIQNERVKMGLGNMVSVKLD